MYYHAIVETTDKNKKGDYERCYELDCENLDEIIDLIVRPFSRNEQIYVSGMHIDRQKVRLLKIKSSERPLAELRDIAQSTVGLGVIFGVTHTQHTQWGQVWPFAYWFSLGQDARLDPISAPSGSSELFDASARGGRYSGNTTFIS